METNETLSLLVNQIHKYNNLYNIYGKCTSTPLDYDRNLRETPYYGRTSP